MKETFNFLSKKKYAFVFSLSVILLGAVLYFIQGGFNFGIDFQGGSQLQVDIKKEITPADITAIIGKEADVARVGDAGQEFLIKAKIPKEINWDEVKEITQNKVVKTLTAKLADAKVNGEISYNVSGIEIPITTEKEYSTDKIKEIAGKGIQVSSVDGSKKDFLIRTNISQLLAKKKVVEPLLEKYPELEIKDDTVYDPTQGDVIKEQAWVVSILVLVLILLYIGLRFQIKFGVAAIVALVHDVIFVLAFIIFFNREFDIPTLVALLTIMGYSLNDTIVVFDRIRENQDLLDVHDDILVINRSIYQSLSRTVVTSLTTLFVVLCIFIFGGPALNNLSFALLVGIIVGTYSSIFVASPALVLWEKFFEKEEEMDDPKAKKKQNNQNGDKILV